MDSCDYINASFIDVRTHTIEHNIPSFVNVILRVMVGEPMPMLQHKVCMTVNIDISDTYTYIRASGGVCGTFLENGVGEPDTNHSHAHPVY